MLGIAEMFAELDGYERYEDAVVAWCELAKERRREQLADPQYRRDQVRRVSRWKKENPELVRIHARRVRERINADPVRLEALRRRRREQPARKTYRIRNIEKVREWNRRNQAARRARLKAQRQAQKRAA